MSQKYVSKRNKKRQKKQRWMPVFFGVAGLALVAVAILAFTAAKNPPKGSENAPVEVNGSPSLKVDKEQVDLGDVKLGQTVEVSFKLSNVGDQTLEFSEKPYIEVVEGC